MKQCTQCKIIKDDSEFSKGRFRKRTQDYALASQCKECGKKYKRTYYDKNRDACLDRAKQQRENDPDGMKAYWKQYHQDNKEARNTKVKQYAKTERGKAARKRAYDNYRFSEEGKVKERARNKVNKALRDGKLTKPEECTVCQKTRPLEAHHADYSKPLEVQWLCKKCHEDTHHLNEGHKPLE